MAESCLEIYLVKIRQTANITAPISAKIDPSEIIFVVGLKIIITPTKPTNIVVQRL